MNPTERQTPKTLERVVWIILMLVIVGIAAAFFRQRLSPPPPVFWSVTNFQLTNQLNRPVSLATLSNQVWIADIIFTRCPVQCLRMSREMRDLMAMLPKRDDLKAISLTADPVFDSPAVLQKYGERFKADAERWWFLTGTKEEIVRLALDGLKLSFDEISPAQRESVNDLFVHSTRFIIVDKRGRVRAWFDGEAPETKARAAHIVKQLLAER